MPSLQHHEWEGHNIQVLPVTKDVRIFFLPRLVLLPYFWDTEICFDLTTSLVKGSTDTDEMWDYDWELCDLDDKIVKKSTGTINILNKPVGKYWGLTSHSTTHKDRAISLPLLHPHKEYILYITLSNSKGHSEREKYATFTVKDRDEVYMQLFIALVVIFMGILIGVTSKGCGL